MPRCKKPPLYPPRKVAEDEPPPPAKLLRQTGRKKAGLLVPRDDGRMEARLAARLVYVTDPARPSIEELATRPEFKNAGISAETMRTWAQGEKWLEQRQDFIDQVFERAKAQVGRRMAQDYVSICETMRDMYFSGLRKMLGEDPNFQIPEARSYEGMIRALAFVASKYADMARDVIDATTPQSAAAATASPAAPGMVAKLTPEENRAAVAAILRLRSGAGSADNDDKKALTSTDETQKT
jgi:hypothetical protein